MTNQVPAPANLVVSDATESERVWAARLMASSDPWITLGRDLEQCRAVCERPGYLMFVAKQAGQPLGFALLHPRGLAGSPYLASLAVAPGSRSRGVGAALLGHGERYFAATSRHFFLCVSSFNTRARAFYERHGYRQVGEFPDYVIEGASELLMHKRLDLS